MLLEEIVQNAAFTILLGKNGAGKSSLLRRLDQSPPFKTSYISPERGGVWKYNANVDHNMSQNRQYLANDRRKNRTEAFRAQSAVHMRTLELAVLRRMEADASLRSDPAYTFQRTLDDINGLLGNVKLLRSDQGMKVEDLNGGLIDEENLSSGESELLALATEILFFAQSSGEHKLLLLDEPDVHLHPDLQQKLIRFMCKLAKDHGFKVALATHSTAIIGAFDNDDDVKIVPVLSRNQNSFTAFERDDVARAILPIFGSHPLSTQFHRCSPLLVEGDDDRRVFDQVVRSSQGRIVFAPCPVGTVNQMAAWEGWLNSFLPAIYDQPRAYSLRDLDDAPMPAIDDNGCVIRMRLNCRSIENILVCDESLSLCGHDSVSFRQSLEIWIANWPSHSATPEIAALLENFGNRRTHRIKDVRNVIVGLLGISKPWEVHVGQLIAALKGDSGSSDSLRNYLGAAVVDRLLT